MTQENHQNINLETEKLCKIRIPVSYPYLIRLKTNVTTISGLENLNPLNSVIPANEPRQEEKNDIANKHKIRLPLAGPMNLQEKEQEEILHVSDHQLETRDCPYIIRIKRLAPNLPQDLLMNTTSTATVTEHRRNVDRNRENIVDLSFNTTRHENNGAGRTLPPPGSFQALDELSLLNIDHNAILFTENNTEGFRERYLADVVPGLNRILHRPNYVSAPVTIRNRTPRVVRPAKRLVNTVEEHSLGLLDQECILCRALHYKGEKKTNGAYKDCCHFGKVKLPARGGYPPYFKSLLTNAAFKRNIRSYNCSMAFASMGGEHVEPRGPGPYCFILQGQVYHTTYNLSPGGEVPKKFSQLYVLDTSEASEIRAGNRYNSGCEYLILANLDRIIREINPYAAAYYNMAEVVRQARSEDRYIGDITMVFNRNIERTANRFNMPTADEIAMVFVDPNGEPPYERDLKIYAKRLDFDTIQLSVISPHLDPMTYVLFYPRGESGWQPNLYLIGYEGGVLNKISMLQYKIAQLAIRRDEFNPILHEGKLFQQWVTDSYMQVESNNLNYIRLNQDKLKAAKYKGLADFISGENANSEARPVILPSTFSGSPRNMRERYFDSMAIVAKFGKPDLFITGTCNPKWKEIVSCLKSGETASDRPDIVSRVFRSKLNAIILDIIKKKIFGEVIAYVYTIEFQKRGLPHAHMLFILRDKLETIEDINDIISAEIPSPDDDPVLHQIVMKHMIHGPCGEGFPNAPCMNDGVCSKNFPKQFNVETKLTERYPEYQRSRIGQYVSRGVMVDNRNVVPYNGYLLKKYNCHINVENCSSAKSVKYIFKYVHKGFDCANLHIYNGNEVDYFVSTRYVSAPEATWRLLEFKMSGKSHVICRLPVHLPNEQLIYYLEGEESQALERESSENSKLISWFKLNIEDQEARNYNYTEIPTHYVYKDGKWKKRQKQKERVIARMFTVAPVDRERYFLRVLLLSVKGPLSFIDLRTFEGTIYDSFEGAALARGLIRGDEISFSVLREAVTTQMPNSIRLLFALICLHTTPRDPLSLFETFLDAMSEDIQENKKDYVLCWLRNMFIKRGLTLETFNLPNPEVIIEIGDNEHGEIDILQHQNNIESLNDGQRRAFEIIRDKAVNGGGFIFLDGPAGTGKTFLYKVIIDELQSLGKYAIPLATTGIAADLLKGGRTVHSGFKLPVPLNETSISRINLGSPEAEKIKGAALILIDEVSMMSKFALGCIDEILRRICNNSDKFGGKTILLGGDFRQTANVVPRGTRNDIIEHSIKSSRLWNNVTICYLTENMRCRSNEAFARWLLNVGEGVKNDIHEQVDVPSIHIEDGCLITSIFGEGEIDPNNVENKEKIILTSKNEHATVLNNRIVELISGEAIEYRSIDSIESEDPGDYINYPLEFLRSLQPSGMPPHKLTLKKGTIVMLLRNLDPGLGLLNGTRLIIKEMYQNYITGEILTGSRRGNIVPIPKIDLNPSDITLPFKLRRFQLPLVIAFAITIHKSQGQTYKKVGVYLPEQPFTHGQVYVALSRVQEKENLKISIPRGSARKLTNVVYSELL